jgi:CDP-glycerol glycerophosphotransferase (TagB/SpsB family)
VRFGKFVGGHILPRSRSIVFVSIHPDDPDALVILEYLARNSDRPLSWMCLGQEPETSLLEAGARERVRSYRIWDFRSAIQFLRSELVFHTYGIPGVLHTAQRQTVVNVWHGDGPKVMRPDPMPTTFMVTGVREFGARRMKILGLPVDRLLVTGRPRVDDIHRCLAPEDRNSAYARLGLDDRPIIWWLPTWREGRSGPARLEADLTEIFSGYLLGGAWDEYQFLVKPHANSPVQEWPKPWRVITAADLSRSGVRWYQLLGEASAIITDYSSVWSDILDSSVPCGFLVPDRDEYSLSRGFYMEDWEDLLPGPILYDQHSFVDFLLRLHEGQFRRQQIHVSHVLGANNSPGATARLFVALTDLGVQWR